MPNSKAAHCTGLGPSLTREQMAGAGSFANAAAFIDAWRFFRRDVCRSGGRIDLPSKADLACSESARWARQQRSESRGNCWEIRGRYAGQAERTNLFRADTTRKAIDVKTFIASACLVAGFIANAGAQNLTPHPGQDTAPGVSGTLRVTGSDQLVALMDRWQRGFRQLHAEVRFALALEGNASGMYGLEMRTADIALMGRPINPTERKGVYERAWVYPIEIQVATSRFSQPDHPAPDAGPHLEPDPKGGADRKDPLSRPVYIFYTIESDKAGIAAPRALPLVQEFLRYVLSPQGQQTIAEDGVSKPLPAAEVAAQLSRLDTPELPPARELQEEED